MDKKYRILYNDQAVVDVLEDFGTTFLGVGSGLMVMVDTKENAKVMLEAIGVNTARLFGESILPISPVTGIDYLEKINKTVDPYNLIEEGVF